MNIILEFDEFLEGDWQKRFDAKYWSDKVDQYERSSTKSSSNPFFNDSSKIKMGGGKKSTLFKIAVITTAIAGLTAAIKIIHNKYKLRKKINSTEDPSERRATKNDLKKVQKAEEKTKRKYSLHIKMLNNKINIFNKKESKLNQNKINNAESELNDLKQKYKKLLADYNYLKAVQHSKI